NIERIRAITHPTNFNDDERKRIKQRFQAEAAKMPRVKEVEQADIGEKDLEKISLSHSNSMKPKYSVLIIGKIQTGKSALVEHIKNYANPNYNINTTLLGNGNVAKTRVPRTLLVESTLPVYEVYKVTTGETISLDNLSAKFDDMADYHDFLMSRDKDVGMRISPQDPNSPSEPIEFQFLDTPGLDSTFESHTAHAANIINEIINIRIFNLIVIVISYGLPLTQKQQLALEYYASVFKGLHTRIMFLHTHVDYANIHHSNSIHHTNMKMKNKALSKMFRRYDTESIFDEDNVKEYSSLTINLISRKRPVINCLIRNTIREILKKATEPPAILDTSSQNIERIRAITSKFNDYEYKRINQRFQDEATKMPKVEEVEQEDVGGYFLEQINILLIGDVQSGKSSLVETFRFYADRGYVVNTQHITQGNSRIADEKVKVTAFLSDLHTVEIRRLRQNNGGHDVIDLEKEASRMTEEDFEDLLNLGTKGAVTAIVHANPSKRYRFNIYEGPSLNESAEDFEKNIFSVHRTLVESKAEIHQVLFTLAPGPITSTIRTTVRICSDIFSDLASLFSFVHTKIDYTKLHIGNKQFQDSLKEGIKLLQKYIQSSTAHFLIDCNLQSNWPVQRAKTYNVVHEILKSATSQMPIVLKSPLMKKTPKMVLIDTNLKWQAHDAFQDTQEEITQNNKDLLELRSKIRQLALDYKNKGQEMHNAKKKQDIAMCDDIEVIFEDKFMAAADPYPEISSQIMIFEKQPRMVEKVHMVAENVEIELFLGGEGSYYWMVIYRHTSGAAASLVVKLYAKKQDSAGNPVGETEELSKIRRERLDLEEQLAVVEERIQSLWLVQKKYHQLRYWIDHKTLPKAVMEELIKTEVYKIKETPFDKIKEIYLKPKGVYDCKICGDKECNKASCEAELNPKTGSVLMFGKTQAGKSSFIEFVKSYADPEYKIDNSRIGTGFRSKTEMPIEFVVKSNLPVYEVFDSHDKRIDIGTLSYKYMDPEDYLDALNDRKATLRPVPQNPGTSLCFVEITLLDTPGIEDTNGRDVDHAPKIIEAMAKMKSLNLIIVIINCKDTPSVSNQLAFNYYSKVIHTFQGHHSNIVFLYTHADYEECHHSNTEHLSVMELRHKALSQLFRRQGSYSRDDVSKAAIELYPMYNIDLKERQRPITRCMRLTTLREILSQVVNKPPVILDTSPSNLQRIEGIPHPDKLNKMHRKQILEATRAILEDREPYADVLVTASEGSMTQDDNPNNTGNDGRVTDQSVCYLDDCADYFSDLWQPECLGSGDEDEDDRLGCAGSSNDMDLYIEVVSMCPQDTHSNEE
ncbi:hypothetical protein BG006_010634, partial [Podila minutissima]